MTCQLCDDTGWVCESTSQSAMAGPARICGKKPPWRHRRQAAAHAEGVQDRWRVRAGSLRRFDDPIPLRPERRRWVPLPIRSFNRLCSGNGKGDFGGQQFRSAVIRRPMAPN